MTHILPPGKYVIANKEQNLYLGRGIHNQEPPLRLTEIVTLPGGVRAPIWKVERLNNGRYKLIVSTFPPPPSPDLYATDIDGRIYGILEGPTQPTEWIISQMQGHGPNVYMIQSPVKTLWTVPEEAPYTQVILEPMMPYSPNQLFTFYPEDDEDRI